MIDISTLDKHLVSRFAGLYKHIEFFNNGDPTKATKRQTRKYIRIFNQYSEWFPESFKKMNTDEILILAKECYELEQSVQKEKQESLERCTAKFDEGVKHALDRLINVEFWAQVNKIDSDVQIITSEADSYRQVITLKNADGIPDNKDGYNCHNFELRKNGDKFCISGELENPIDGTVTPFEISFDDVKAEVISYNACNQMFWDSPWFFLQSICYAIKLKSELPGDNCNEKEKELLPLISEISVMNHYVEHIDDSTFSFPELKKLLIKFGYTKLLAIPDKLSQKFVYRKMRKFHSLLCKKQYEPLWREIYNRIADSQREYPDKMDTFYDQELLNNTREKIQKLMEEKGYIGTYPEFVKDGVTKRKRAQYHIRCQEELCSSLDSFEIQFVCGTAFLKDEEDEADAFGCLFNADGNRSFAVTCAYLPYDRQEDGETKSIETDVEIAVKLAEKIKLTKEESKAYYGRGRAGAGLFFLIFLIAGGLFAVAMTLAMMIFCTLVTVLFGLWREIPEMLQSVPWGWIFAFGWVAFGSAIGIIEVLAHRR